MLSLWVILTLWCFTAPAQVLEQDSLALVAFYNSTGGSNWNNNSNWLTGPVSTWYGVTVEGDRVTELIINSNNLSGTLPEELGQLTALQSLGMSNDSQLTGVLPESLFQITTLKWFGIGNCSLTGTIPVSIGNCYNLFEFSLPKNNLTGPIPPEIGNLDSLMFIDLHDNQLTGPIPPELGNCINLWELWLNDNLLTGEIPSELANLNKVYYLNLSFNQLEGDIPDQLAKVTSYEDLFFNNNNLTGIPSWADNWFLNALALQNNKMTFEDIEPHFVGYIWYNYAPQDSIGIKIDTVLIPESNFSIYSGTGGEYTEYLWYKNGELLLQGTETDTLYLYNISNADTGLYQCWATNSLATDLTLIRRPIHISLDTGTNITGFNANKSLRIFPNPTNENLTIELPYNERSILVHISDIQGKCILKKEIDQHNTSPIKIDVNEILPGIYILQMQTENNKYSTKFIKNRQGIHR